MTEPNDADRRQPEGTTMTLPAGVVADLDEQKPDGVTLEEYAVGAINYFLDINNPHEQVNKDDYRTGE